jgi:hypothetical protein
MNDPTKTERLALSEEIAQRAIDKAESEPNSEPASVHLDECLDRYEEETDGRVLVHQPRSRKSQESDRRRTQARLGAHRVRINRLTVSINRIRRSAGRSRCHRRAGGERSVRARGSRRTPNCGGRGGSRGDPDGDPEPAGPDSLARLALTKRGDQ